MKGRREKKREEKRKKKGRGKGQRKDRRGRAGFHSKRRGKPRLHGPKGERSPNEVAAAEYRE